MRYISNPFIVFLEVIFVGVEEDEVDTLDYPMDGLINLFNPLDYGLHQIFATFCVGGVFN